MRLPHLKFELANQNSAGGKNSAVPSSGSKWVNKKSIEVGQLFSLATVSNIHRKAFAILKAIPDCKKWKLWNILSLQASNLATTSGNSFVVCRVSPSRIIVVILNKIWLSVLRQIKPRILKLTIKRGQGTICIVFICVYWEGNDFYRVVSAGQLSFDSQTYCGRSGGMQGAGNEEENVANFVPRFSCTNSRWWIHLFPPCACAIKWLFLLLTERNAASSSGETNDERLSWWQTKKPRSRLPVSCDVINDFRPATQSVKCVRFVLIAATMRRPLSSFSLLAISHYSWQISKEKTPSMR